MTAPAPDLTAPAAPAPKISVWEDFIDIFYAPSSVYERRRLGQFGLALVVLMVATALLVAGFWNALSPMFEATTELAIREQIAKGDLPPEAAAAARGFGTTWAAVGVVVGVPFIVLLGAFGIWLFGKLLDASLSFAQAMTVMTYAQIPRLLGWIVLGVQGLLGDASGTMYSYMIGPTRFVDPDTSMMTMALLGRLELFTLWATALIGIGVAVIARVPRGRGFAVAAIVWVVGSALMVVQAM